MPENNRILLICSDEGISVYLREKLIINGGYLVSSEVSYQGGVAAFKKSVFDIVIVKFNVSDVNSINAIREIKKIEQECIIIVLVDDHAPQITTELSRLGVYDFISKPISLEKLFFLIRKGIDLHSFILSHHKLTQIIQEQNVSLQKQNTLLAKRIEESTKNLSRLYEDLRTTYMRTIKVLAQAIDARDHYTHSHSQNVARYAEIIAQEMGISAADTEVIREACELHDLGKIGVEDNILGKPSGLTKEEWEQIKHHPDIGAQILEPLTFMDGVIDLVKQHHEHYDGTGYPQGLKGDDILLGARIIHLADAYEAMRSERSYRKIPLSKEEAILEISRNSGTSFDPKVVGAFLKVAHKLE